MVELTVDVRPALQEGAIVKNQGTTTTDDRRHITVRVDIKQWRKLKQLALRTDSTLQDLAIEGYNRLLAEYGLGSI